MAAVLLAGAAAFPGACSRGGSDAPPEIHFGQDVCAACTMIVSEQRFAAAIVPDDGRGDPLAFDDIGCLLAWERRHPDAPVLARWVHDHEGPDWLRAESAWYVRSPELRSPMGSGVVAVADDVAARGLSEERDGSAMDWSALRTEATERGLVRPPAPAGAGSGGDPGYSEG